ncbi:MAG: methylated-DNA--[protein]-cysteine S-methyltransferase [Rhodocyclaceae bacterium]|nr:methylated-DNA--[protein]-cysteine S-methyltransferase [Rhodocyclaceae bacterium]MBK6906059.1 methylated-DNA--[protein]-cysteine S-methyltransferase [Rhodocyclaceae bacterium]
MPQAADSNWRQYTTVEKAIHYLRAHAHEQPDLADIAAAVHMSPHHLQRVFSEWAGISPKRFLQYLTKDYARKQLARTIDTLSVATDAGLSSTSRLHDLMVSCEAMSPGEIQSGGRGVIIGYGVAVSPFGDALIAWTARGVCHLAFYQQNSPALLSELQELWPHACLEQQDMKAGAWLERIFPRSPTRGTVHLVLRGTNFQIKVWEALLNVASGELRSYSQIAAMIGSPRAARAVGSALAANTIGYLIPCHRVIRESGDINHYRWGTPRKQAMLAWEAAHQADSQTKPGC